MRASSASLASIQLSSGSNSWESSTTCATSSAGRRRTDIDGSIAATISATERGCGATAASPRTSATSTMPGAGSVPAATPSPSASASASATYAGGTSSTSSSADIISTTRAWSRALRQGTR